MKLTAYQEHELERAAEWGRLSWRSTETLEKRGLVRAVRNGVFHEVLLLVHRKVHVTVAGVRIVAGRR